jgi:outer membrane protein OmpA-like peptidoglycan-associated protein
MRNLRISGIVLFAVATLFLAAPPASAADLTFNAVLYPEDEKTPLVFTTAERAPKAKLSGTVRPEAGQSWIEVSWSKLEPALLFGGDANCWVLWTITPDGTAQSLGEIPVRESRSGSVTFSSPFKQFAMMVTAEPFPVVRRPSDLVVFLSAPTESKKAKNSTFTFGGFREGMKRDVESIADLKYDDKTPVDLQQARKAIALMDRYEAEKYAQAPAREARVALGQADDAFEGRVGKKGDVPELSRRTLSLAAEAVRAAVKQIELQKAQDTEAARVAELAQKQAETEAEKAARLKTEADLAEVQKARRALEVEVARVEAEKAAIQKERDALAARLSGALGKVSATERTGRGLVVSLSGGILFETGKAALKTDAKVSLAKLAGILLMIPNANIQVEGHTDSTGTEETNAKLSLARATSVLDFLEAQGVEKGRMSAKGVAAAQPVAPNDTPDGRAKNRRVEIVVPE